MSLIDNIFKVNVKGFVNKKSLMTLKNKLLTLLKLKRGGDIMKKIIKLSILVILLSLLTMLIIIPGNLKAYHDPGASPGFWFYAPPFGPACWCPCWPPECRCSPFN
jgi:hypothetical protein